MPRQSNQRQHKDGGEAWYVVHIRSRHEAKVQSGLESLGLEVFLPQVTTRSRRRDRFQLVERPLFPGYLFVNTDLSFRVYSDIIRRQGVVRILGSKGCCTPVAPGTVASIQSILESGRGFYPRHQLVTGQLVRVVSGPLKGVTGTIWRRKPGQNRLVVGVELLCRSLAVDLEEECVEPFLYITMDHENMDGSPKCPKE